MGKKKGGKKQQKAAGGADDEHADTAEAAPATVGEEGATVGSGAMEGPELTTTDQREKQEDQHDQQKEEDQHEQQQQGDEGAAAQCAGEADEQLHNDAVVHGDAEEAPGQAQLSGDHSNDEKEGDTNVDVPALADPAKNVPAAAAAAPERGVAGPGAINLGEDTPADSVAAAESEEAGTKSGAEELSGPAGGVDGDESDVNRSGTNALLQAAAEPAVAPMANATDSSAAERAYLNHDSAQATAAAAPEGEEEVEEKEKKEEKGVGDCVDVSVVALIGFDPASLDANEAFKWFQRCAQRPESAPFVQNLEAFIDLCTSIAASVQPAQIHGYIAGAVGQLERCGGVWERLLAVPGGEAFIIEGLERYIMTLLHSQCLLGSKREAELNNLLHRKLCAIRRMLPMHFFVSVDDILRDEEIEVVAMELRRMGSFKTPREKLECATRAVDVTLRITSRIGIADDVRSADFSLALLLCVCHAAPPNFHANVRFIEQYREPAFLTPAANQVLALLSTAAEFFIECDGASIGVDEEVFEELLTEEARRAEEELVHAAKKAACEGYESAAQRLAEDEGQSGAARQPEPSSAALRSLEERIEIEDRRSEALREGPPPGYVPAPRVVELEAEVDAMRSEQAGLAEALADAASRVTALEGALQRVDAAEDSVRNLRNTTLMLHQHHKDHVAELGGATERIADLEESATRTGSTVDALSRSVSDNDTMVRNSFAAFQEQVRELRGGMEELARRVDRALRLEQLPPAREVPDGPKIRLLIGIVCGGAVVKELMVPISSNGSVADVKLEALRRARQQGLLDEDAAVPSRAVLTDTAGIVFYEEDSLADVGVGAGERLRLEFTSKLDITPSPRLQSPQSTTGGAAGFSGGGAGTGRNPSLSSSTSLLSPPEPPSSPAFAAAGGTSSGTGAARSGQGLASAPPLFPNNNKSDVSALHQYVLAADVCEDLLERETLERRLQEELFRMELEPLANQERLCRVQVVKNAVGALRNRLVDRATYSVNDVHRSIARAALHKLNQTTDIPGVSISEMEKAMRVAEVALEQTQRTASAGEGNRVSALEDMAKVEQHRKGRAVESMKELIDSIQCRIRIPSHLMGRAEQLINTAETAIILAPSSSRDELEKVVAEMEMFVVACKS